MGDKMEENYWHSLVVFTVIKYDHLETPWWELHVHGFSYFTFLSLAKGERQNCISHNLAPVHSENKPLEYL